MEKSHPYPHVFAPLRIGPITVKNRIQFSPVVSAHARKFTGKVTAVTREADGNRVSVDITAVNQKGDTTGAGMGSCVVPSGMMPQEI